jgi:hypothetical protein
VKAGGAKESTSFLKKRSKKLLIPRLCRRNVPHETVHGSKHKSFLVPAGRAPLFSKKNRFLPSADCPGCDALRHCTAAELSQNQ